MEAVRGIQAAIGTQQADQGLSDLLVSAGEAPGPVVLADQEQEAGAGVAVMRPARAGSECRVASPSGQRRGSPWLCQGRAGPFAQSRGWIIVPDLPHPRRPARLSDDGPELIMPVL